MNSPEALERELVATLPDRFPHEILAVTPPAVLSKRAYCLTVGCFALHYALFVTLLLSYLPALRQEQNGEPRSDQVNDDMPASPNSKGRQGSSSSTSFAFDALSFLISASFLLEMFVVAILFFLVKRTAPPWREVLPPQWDRVALAQGVLYRLSSIADVL
eukprot:g19234.t1